MSRLTLGVDPGITGAWAVLDVDGALIGLEDLPVIRDGRLAWIDAETFTSRLMELRAGNELHATVERVHAMPRIAPPTAPNRRHDRWARA